MLFGVPSSIAFIWYFSNNYARYNIPNIFGDVVIMLWLHCLPYVTTMVIGTSESYKKNFGARIEVGNAGQ